VRVVIGHLSFAARRPGPFGSTLVAGRVIEESEIRAQVAGALETLAAYVTSRRGT
jgi:hypothetical protein